MNIEFVYIILVGINNFMDNFELREMLEGEDKMLSVKSSIARSIGKEKNKTNKITIR